MGKKESVKAFKLEVTGCDNCPLAEYVGGPHRCRPTGKFIYDHKNQAWDKCPLKEKDVLISLSRK